MENYVISDVLERIDELMDLMEANEEIFYVAIETLHELRDEVQQIEPIYEDDE